MPAFVLVWQTLTHAAEPLVWLLLHNPLAIMISTGTDFRVERTKQSRLSGVDFQQIPFGKIYSDHMFAADYIDGKWSDLRIVPFENISLSPAISALHYGQSIFEGMKAFKNQKEDKVMLFRPYENAARFNISAKRMCMPELPENIFVSALHQLVALDRAWVPSAPDSSLYIRPFMFATDAYIGLKPSEAYSFYIFCSPVGRYYSAPVKVKVETQYTRAAIGGTGFAKTSANYAGAMYPTRLAQQQGYDQLLWTDGLTHRFVEESGTMNVLFVFGDTLVSIPTSETILPGIMRKSVLELARSWGLKVEERPVEVAEIISGAKDGSLKEMFGAGTAATITHISHVGFDGVDYALPPVESREISTKLLEQMSGIQRGTVADKLEWMYKI